MRLHASRAAAPPARPLFRRCTRAQPAQPAHTCRANYRWSAEEDGGRKRESLYGYNDNGEPRAVDAGSAAADDDAWQGDWERFVAEAEQQDQQPAAAWVAQQQEAWGAGAAYTGLPRRQRHARGSAAGDDARASRVGRRRQPRLGEQEQEAAASAPPPEDDDPWVAAELRQLRRRQAAGGGGAAAAADGAAAPRLPDPWAAEWGPLQGAPAAAAAEDYGWAQESWAQDTGGSSNGARSSRRQQGPAGEGSGAAPGSAWDLQQQQRDARRRRRRSAVPDSDEDDEAAAGGHGARRAAAAAGNAAGYASAGYGYSGGAYAEEEREWERQLEEDEYLNDNYGDDVAPGSARWRASSADGAAYSTAYEPGVSAEPDIALLSPDELDRVLPITPFSQQAAFFSGSATDGLQRWGAALALTVLFSKVALLATTSLSWPLWWPWALAAKKNLAVRRQYRYGGLWRTRVLEVATTSRPRAFAGAEEGGLLGRSTMRMARVLVGDPGGAQTEMALPYDSRYELIQPGEPAELVVLSGDLSFESFKAVKDVYLPDAGLWVSEYPHCDRTQFLDVSLAVEREAQEAAAAGGQPQPAQQAPYGAGGWEQPPPQQQYGGGAWEQPQQQQYDGGQFAGQQPYGQQQQQQPYGQQPQGWPPQEGSDARPY